MSFSDPHPADRETIGARRKLVATRLLEAMAARDAATVSDCLAEEVTWWVPQSAADRGIVRPLRGREVVLGLLCGESRYEVGTMRWEYHHVLHDDDVVTVHCTLRARTRAGLTYENQYALLYRFDGDSVIEGWEHTDTSYAFARLLAES